MIWGYHDFGNTHVEPRAPLKDSLVLEIPLYYFVLASRLVNFLFTSWPDWCQPKPVSMYLGVLPALTANEV